jgi:glycosyl transferase, family 25
VFAKNDAYSFFARGRYLITTFLINLARSVDRLASMQAQAQRIGLTYERFPGVLGAALPQSIRDKFLVDGRVGSQLQPGEVGCYASHLMVCQEILRRGISSALVLEDDAQLDDDLIDVVENALAAAPDGWDVIKLCNPSTRTTIRVARVGNRHLVRYVRQPFLACGYLISNSGAAKMLAPGLRMSPIDMDMRLPWLLGLEVFGVLPEPVKASCDVPSVIVDQGGRGTWTHGKKERHHLDLLYAARRVGWPKVIAAEAITAATKWLPRSFRPRGRII